MKKWEKPQLIVLVRSKPEESLISLCKGGTDGPVTMDRACQVGYDGCMTCQQMSNS